MYIKYYKYFFKDLSFYKNKPQLKCVLLVTISTDILKHFYSVIKIIEQSVTIEYMTSFIQFNTTTQRFVIFDLLHPTRSTHDVIRKPYATAGVA